MKMIAGDYILQNKPDSAELVLLDVIANYERSGFHIQALQTLTMLMHIYKDLPNRLNDLRQVINRYDRLMPLMENHTGMSDNISMFHYYKGYYLSLTGQLDSAEFYYRKTGDLFASPSFRSSIYEGLLHVFQKRNNIDSIAKYATLYCIANDSSVAVNDQQVVARMTASYNYNRLQKQASKNAIQAEEKTKLATMLALTIVLIVVVVTLLSVLYRNIQKRKRIKLEQGYREELRRQQRLQVKREEELQTVHRHEQASLHQRYLQEKELLIKQQAQEIAELKDKGTVLATISESRKFAETEIYKKVKRIAKHPLEKPTEQDWAQLTAAISEFFPLLYHDISLLNSKNKELKAKICMLSAIGVGNIEQASILHTSKQTISNNMASLNMTLFNDDTARTFPNNLKQHYSIFL